MADNTRIEWADASLNPLIAIDIETGKRGWHCTHTSEGCRHCYAESINRRLGTGLAYKPGHEKRLRIEVNRDQLEKPMHWRRSRRIFVGSMTDIFADFVTDEQIAELVAWFAAAWWHDFLLLTKRPDRMRRLFTDQAFWDMVEAILGAIDHVADELGLYDPLARRRDDWRSMCPDVSDPAARPVANLWLGTSAEDQCSADQRIPDLLATPAAVRWISAEPLLGPLDLTAIKQTVAPGFFGDCLQWHHRGKCHADEGLAYPRLDWIVAGGESGPGARPMHPDWVRALRDQCGAAGVPFFFKQWGEWGPVGTYVADVSARRIYRGELLTLEQRGKPTVKLATPLHDDDRLGPPLTLQRVGKVKAGRLLDGREHNDFPQRREA